MSSNSNMPLVSVIIPVFNIENYIERCVISISQQDYKNLEIILVDDGSTDGSSRLCDKFAKQDKRILTIHQKNGGLSSARNAGLSAKHGDFVLFVDGDDWLSRKAISTLMLVQATTKADLVEFDFNEIYANSIIASGKCTGDIASVTASEAIGGSLFWKKFKTVAWNKLYKAALFDGIKFPVGKLHEDEFITYQLYYAAKKIVKAEIALYNYDRSREGSITAKFKIKNLDGCEAVRNRMVFIREHPDLKNILTEACDSYCFTLFDNLEKCVQDNLSGEILDHTIDDAMAEKTFLMGQKIEPFYKKCLKLLGNKKLDEVIKEWRKVKPND